MVKMEIMPNLKKVLWAGNKGDKPILISDGSSSAPSYSFSGDTTMGLYRDGVNLHIQENASGNLFINGGFRTYYTGSAQASTFTNNSAGIAMGNSAGVALYWSKSTTSYHTSFNWALGSGVKRTMVISDYNNRGTDFPAFIDYSNPSLVVTSSTLWTVAADEYMRFQHNGTDGVITTGKGSLNLDSSGDIRLMEDTFMRNHSGIFWQNAFHTVGGINGSDVLQIAPARSVTGSGNNIVAIVDYAQLKTNMGSGSMQTDPTLRIYSHNAGATNQDEYINITHNGTDGVLSTGKGRIKVDSGMRLKHITTTTDYTILESDYIIGGNTNNSYGSDILTDGTMDIWTDSNTLTNWNKDLVGGPGNAILDQEGTIKTDGSYSAKITNDSDGTSISLSQEHTGLTTTDTYTFSVDARNGGSGNAILFFLNSAGDHIWNFTTESWDSYSPPPSSDQEKIITLSSTFANYTANVKPYSDGSLVPYINGDIGNASTIVYFDNAKLQKKTVGTAITLTLPTAVEGATYIIKDEGGNASSNNITIATPGTETIDSSASTTIVSNYNSVTLYSDGSNWFII